jgi:hypothetical protein
MTPKQRLAKKKANARHEERESSYVEREETRKENEGWSEARAERRAHRLKSR